MTTAGWLSEKELVYVTGNMFDKDTLIIRIGDAVLSWTAGAGTVLQHEFPSPRKVAEIYKALRDPIAATHPGLP
eukprot:14670718-Heterocapsa_arctica.AAC.1